MSLKDVNKRLQRIVDLKTKDLVFDYIRSDLKDKFLNANKRQIFRDSEDIYGYPLGFYSYSTERNYDSSKKKDTPYTMIDSGNLEKGMYIRVSNKFQKIYIGSRAVSGRLFEIENNTEIFGLQNHRLEHIIKRWIQPYIIKQLSIN